MSSTLANPVHLTPGFTILDDQAPQPFVLYTIVGAAPERIEAVSMSIAYGTPPDPVADVYVLELVDQSGLVVSRQPTPLIEVATGPDFILYLNWTRRGNDTAKAGLFTQLDSGDNTRRGWTNMTLPDLVLQPQSKVRLLVYKDDGFESGPFPVSDCSVTTTSNAGAVSTTTLADVLPMLTPTDEG